MPAMLLFKGVLLVLPKMPVSFNSLKFILVRSMILGGERYFSWFFLICIVLFRLLDASFVVSREPH